MTEAKKVVIEDYPFERLPDDLQARFEGHGTVRLTIEQQAAAGEPRPLHEMYGFARGLYASQGIDPTEFVRQLRDEWD